MSDFPITSTTRVSEHSGLTVSAGIARRACATLIDAGVLVVFGSGSAAVHSVLLALCWILATLIVAPLYFTLCHGGRSGQTLGMRAVGISLLDSATFGRVGYGRALLRLFAIWALWVVYGIPNLASALLRADRRPLHDVAARTVVVRL